MSLPNNYDYFSIQVSFVNKKKTLEISHSSALTIFFVQILAKIYGHAGLFTNALVQKSEGCITIRNDPTTPGFAKAYSSICSTINAFSEFGVFWSEMFGIFLVQPKYVGNFKKMQEMLSISMCVHRYTQGHTVTISNKSKFQINEIR